MSSSLHNHTEYSVLDGFGHPEEYLIQAQKIGLKAFAVTEHGNEYSWVYFDELKSKYPDVKMIYGVEFYECFDHTQKDKDNKYFHLLALAKNEQGRIALNELIAKSNFDGFYFKPRVDLAMMKPYAENLIVSSACLASKISRESDLETCTRYVQEYKNIFPHFYLEMQSHDTEEQKSYNQKILRIAKETNTPFIITTDSHAAAKEDLKYQGYHVRIARDNETASELYNGCYMQTDEEIHAIMDKQIGMENVAYALQETDRIADLVDVVNMPYQSPQLPTYPLPEGFQDNAEFLRHLCEQGWSTRHFNEMSEKDQKIRRDRMEYELSVIHQMGFDGYFLIVWDFINYAKSHDIIVGDGRGSGGGSIVNYLLHISELDPIDYDLIFERFLNPERVSMPDIDIDFADRESIINYLCSKYGDDRVCQIINFSYITPIVAIKDVGRVLGIPYYISDKISKKFTYPTFKECIQNSPDIYEKYSEYGELFDIASHISGRVRNVSIHAGGVGIVDTKITDYMAMKLGGKGEHVIQVDKRKIEEIGIIKFDILGVATLGIVQEVKKAVGLSDWDISVANPHFLHDKETFDLLKAARTNGVFQVESSGMKDLLMRLEPENLEDMSAVLALYRPDSMSMLEDYIYYKHHPDEVQYWHPDMKPILEKTYGCIIYQEEIMDIVRVFGGRSRGGADLYRKAIGKKNIELVKKESEKLYTEIMNQGYDEPLAKKISEHFSQMGSYSFNKSHSALYSVLTLKTAYLKAHYPAHFFCALLNQNKGNYGTINKYILDARDFDIEILPPDLNHSSNNFTVINGKILFGFEAVNGIGKQLSDQIITQRNIAPFKNFSDFAERVNPSAKQIVFLAKAGAFPTENIKKFLLRYAKHTFPRREYSEVSTLPKLSVLNEKYGIDTSQIKCKEERLRLYNQAKEREFTILQSEKYNKHMREFSEKYLADEDFWEFEALSVFIKNNPFEEAYQYISKGWDDIENEEECIVVGIVSNVQKKKDRNKNQYAFLNLYSAFGLIELTCWNSQFKKYEELIKRGNQIAALTKKKDDKAVIIEIKTYQDWLKARHIKI